MWTACWECVGCRQDLTWEQRMWSYGTCPHCGYRGSSGTVCSTVQRVRRWVWDEPALSWWDWLRGKKRKGHWEYK